MKKIIYDLTTGDAKEVAHLARLKFDRQVAQLQNPDQLLKVDLFWRSLRLAYAFIFNREPEEVSLDKIAPSFLFNILLQLDDEAPRILRASSENFSQPEIRENNDEDDEDLDYVEIYHDETELASRVASPVGAVR